MNNLAHARLYAILDLGYLAPAQLRPAAENLLSGGADIVQLRAKDHSPENILAWATELAPLFRSAGVPLIINDHPALAPQAGADGAHIGQDGGPLPAARLQSAPAPLLGRSTHTLAQALAAQSEGADYIGFGPLFPTPTKPGRPAIGLDHLAEVHRLVTIPIFCIGGVTLDTLPAVLAAGARRVVIVSDLLRAPDIALRCREARKMLS